MGRLKVYGLEHRRVIAVATALVLLGAVFSMAVVKTTLPIKASLQAPGRQQVHKPLIVKLGQKLANVDTSKLTIQPVTKGTWQYVKGSMLANDSVVFTPETEFTTDTQYEVGLAGAKRLLVGETSSQRLLFRTESAPSVVSVTQTSKRPLGAVSPFNVTLNSLNRDLRDLTLKTIPEVQLKRASSDDKTFTWTPVTTWPQGTTLKVVVIDEKNDQTLKATEVLIAPEPVVSTPVKQTYFTDKDTASIVFSQPIDQARQPKITFDLEGKGEWANETTYRFSPAKVEPGKTYSYKVEAGLTSKQGGILQRTYDGNFATTGAVGVTRTSPSGTLLRQSSQEIAVTFDQPIDKASAEERFSITHGQIGQKRWVDNTLYVPVSNLGYQQTVTAQVAAGVKNSGFGLPSSRPFSFTFTTENRVTRLNVPFYAQQHSATCAVASLRMALAYRGIVSSEESLVSLMGYNPRPIDKSTDPPTWDDPTQMFVGSIDGSISKGTGAGPDAPPVASAAVSSGRSAQAITRATAGWIASQIHAGNPVIMFGAQSASSGYTTWNTPTGKSITMNLTSHATLVTGVVGEPSSPIGFWVSDPLSGGNAYWSAQAITSNIARDPDGQAVVIY